MSALYFVTLCYRKYMLCMSACMSQTDIMLTLNVTQAEPRRDYSFVMPKLLAQFEQCHPPVGMKNASGIG